MKRLGLVGLALLLCQSAARGQIYIQATPPSNQVPVVTPNGLVYYPQKIGVPIVKVAWLPAYAFKGVVVSVTDGSTAADCSAGAGSHVLECQYDGSAWHAVAGGGVGSTTVNSQTCTLGSTCTIPFQTNGTGNTSQAGINLLTSTVNSVGLTVTPTNSATNAEKFEITGASYNGNAVSASGAQGGSFSIPSLPTPTNGVIGDVATGGSLLPNTQYCYEISGTNALGETLAASEVCDTTADDASPTHKVHMTATALGRASGCNIYGRTTGTELFIAAGTLAGGTCSYDDDGSVVIPSGALPAANTTAGIIVGTANGVTLSCGSITITAITGGIITGASCPE